MLVHCVNTNGNMATLVNLYYQYAAHRYTLCRNQNKRTDVIPSTHVAQPYRRLTDETGALVNWTLGKRRYKVCTQVKCT